MLTPRQVEDAAARAKRVEAESAQSRAAARQVAGLGAGPVARVQRETLAQLSLGRHVGPAEGVSRLSALSDLDRAPDTTSAAFVAPRRGAPESPLRARGSRAAPRFDTLGREVGAGRGSGIAVRRGVPGAWVEAGAPRVVAAPEAWARAAPHATRTELQATRRAAQRPDTSYDLDGDGVVSQRDYMFSVRFDRDADGKLSAEERAAAAAALRAGYAEALRDATGSAADRGILKDSGAASGMIGRAPRQLRGVVVHEADESGWESLTRTYGRAYAAQAVAPPFATQADGGVSGVMAEDSALRATRSLSVGGGAKTSGALARKRRRRDAEQLSAAFDAAVAESSRAPELGVALLQRSSRAALRASTDAADDDDTAKPHARDLDANPSPARSRTELLLSRRCERVEHEVSRGSGGGAVPRWLDAALRASRAPSEAGADGEAPLARSRSELRMRRRAEAAEFGAAAGDRLQTGVGVHAGGVAAQAQTQARVGAEEGVGWWGGTVDDLLRTRTSGTSRRESEPVAPTAATLSQRTISLVDLPERQKKRQGHVADKVTAVDHWTAAAHPPGTAATERRTVRRWTDTVLEHKHADDGADDDGALAEDGKEQYMDARDWAPLYSSFAPDNTFRDQWNAARATARAQRAAASALAPGTAGGARRRNSVYGTPAALAVDPAAAERFSDVSQSRSPPDAADDDARLARPLPPPQQARTDQAELLANTPFARLPKAVADERNRLAQLSAAFSLPSLPSVKSADSAAPTRARAQRSPPRGTSSLAQLAAADAIATSGLRHIM